jgi:adenylylsulfate kinase
MIEHLIPKNHNTKETVRRSLVKTVVYRGVILILDFTCLYLFTGKLNVAVGFTVVSNLYTSICYFFSERIWDKIKWGKVNTG